MIPRKRKMRERKKRKKREIKYHSCDCAIVRALNTKVRLGCDTIVPVGDCEYDNPFVPQSTKKKTEKIKLIPPQTMTIPSLMVSEAEARETPPRA